MTEPDFQPFDILAVSGVSRVSSAIEWATGTTANPARVSHVSLVVEPGDLYTAVAQEALLERQYRCVVRRPLGDYAGTGERVSVWRPLDLDDQQRAAMRAKADATLGCKYGYLNIGLQLIDALLSRAAGRRIVFARRLYTTSEVICSENVSEIWQAAGLSFGVEPGTATPAEINDFCARWGYKYRPIRPLLAVPKRPAGIYLESKPMEAA